MPGRVGGGQRAFWVLRTARCVAEKARVALSVTAGATRFPTLGGHTRSCVLNPMAGPKNGRRVVAFLSNVWVVKSRSSSDIRTSLSNPGHEINMLPLRCVPLVQSGRAGGGSIVLRTKRANSVQRNGAAWATSRHYVTVMLLGVNGPPPLIANFLRPVSCLYVLPLAWLGLLACVGRSGLAER